jgi:hypothetical protein
MSDGRAGSLRIPSSSFLLQQRVGFTLFVAGVTLPLMCRCPHACVRPLLLSTAQEGRFIWSDTGVDTTYTAWAPGQPDGRWVQAREHVRTYLDALVYCATAGLVKCPTASSKCFNAPATTPFHYKRHESLRRFRFGGEDCVATTVKLAGSMGAGLREVVSTVAMWYDMGCTTQLPFICKRAGSLGLPQPRRVPLLTTSLLVFPPGEDDEEMLVTHAEGRKLCRSLGVSSHLSPLRVA